MTTVQLQDLAQKICSAPSEWVLILGDLFSSSTSEQRNRRILELAAGYQKSFSSESAFFRHIQKRDYPGLMDSLFGDVWNGVSFLDDTMEVLLERRRKYAGFFKRKEQINLDDASLDPGKLFGSFPGIILTVCQDEQIEAFWENTASMPAEDNVWTPYSLVTSPKWNRWRKYREEAPFEDIEAYFKNQNSVIFKLYGSCRDPHQMLLSHNDFELYYPTGENGMPCSRLLLQKLFCNKNLILLGADTLFLENQGLPFAPGISRLLENPPAPSLERYLLFDPGSPKKGWEAYHITPLLSAGNYKKELNTFSKMLCKKEKHKPALQAPDVSNHTLTDEEAARLFWKLYTRRPKSSISENEQYILEEQLLKPEGGRRTEQVWSEKGIHLFSMLANNKADFYDLKKLPGPNRSWDSIRCYETALQELLWDGLDKKSLELLQILASYGDGFPLGFLMLLSESQEELKEWKLAGFQLTNSGIYIQRHYRAHLHRRMEYADIVMTTAGSNPNKAEMAHRIEEVGHQLDDSYFYPLDKNYFSFSRDAFSRYLLPEDEIQKVFVRMFQRLLRVLSDKSDGYNHIRSLLETEIHAIIHKLNELNDPKDLEWKPDLLYYLLLESRVLPPDVEEIDRQSPENPA